MSITKIDKLYNMLVTGKEYTSKQIQKTTGLRSVTGAVRDLRAEGHRIFLNQRGPRGNKVNKYRMAA